MSISRVKSYLILMLLMLICGCSKDKCSHNNWAKAVFFANVQGITTKTPIDIGENIPTGDTVGLFALSYIGDNESNVEWPTIQSEFKMFNIEGIIQEGIPKTIQTSKSFYLQNNGQKIAFYSYYPRDNISVYNSGCEPTIDVYIPTSPSNQKDFLWSTPVTGTYITPDLNLVYNHALSLIRIKLHKTCIDEIILKKIIISTVQKQKATMNIATGEMVTNDLPGGNNDFVLSDLSIPIPLKGSEESPIVLNNAKFLFVPGTLISSIKAIVRIAGELFDREYSIINPALTLKKGASINVLLSVSKIGAEISNWDEINDNEEIGEVPSSNCYIISPNSSKYIRVGIKGTGNVNAIAGTDLSITHIAKSVSVLWQTSPDLISLSNFSTTDQTVLVATPLNDVSGNAVIAAYDGINGTGNILWSWHIWVTDYNPNIGATYNFNPDNPLEFMDRNLGAIDNSPGLIDTKGLLYQWGRKDPFPGSTTIDGFTEPVLYGSLTSVIKEPVSVSNNLENSILNPTTFYCGINNVNTGYDWYTNIDNRASQNDALWGSSNPNEMQTAKTIFDPCPAGWRVPAFRNGISPWSILSLTNSTFLNYGRIWITPYCAGFYPASGYLDRSNGLFYRVGSAGYLWSASTCLNINFLSNSLHFFTSDENVNSSIHNNRAYGFSVRCVRE